MREADKLLKRQPRMGILAVQAEALRARLSEQRGSGGPRASTLTGRGVIATCGLQWRAAIRPSAKEDQHGQGTPQEQLPQAGSDSPRRGGPPGPAA
jgi:hypothetical protein